MKINNVEYRFICDIIYFQGSILSLFQRDEQCCLFSWFDCNDSSNSWAIVDLSKNNLRDYLNKQVTLRNIFENSKEIIIFSKSKDEIKIEKTINFNELPLDTIPSDDSFLDYDFSTPEAEKLAAGEEVNLFIISTTELDVASALLPWTPLALNFNIGDSNSMPKLFSGSYEREMSIMKNTVENYDIMEDHMALDSNFAFDDDDNNPLISLFAKNYSGKEKRDDFVMLVVGQRSLTSLSIVFGIRIYDFALRKSRKLINMLRGFIQKFGCRISVNNEKDGFFFSDQCTDEENRNITVKVKEHIFCELKKSVSGTVFYLIFAIDIKKYRKSLRQHHFKFLPI